MTIKEILKEIMYFALFLICVAVGYAMIYIIASLF